jgi:hypothetical protein
VLPVNEFVNERMVSKVQTRVNNEINMLKIINQHMIQV